MNKNDFQRAFDVADNKDIDLSGVDMEVLFGCGLPNFEPVTADIRTVAAHLRWQAKLLNGQWDSEALNDCRNILRYKVTMVG